MEYRIEDLINEELLDVVVLQKSHTPYLNAKIINFKTRYDNGNHFTHSNGEKYGLAYLNAFTEKGEIEIINALKSFPSQSLNSIKEIIEKNRLKVYINGNTKRYLNTITGDEGQVFMNDINNISTVRFVNISAENRK